MATFGKKKKSGMQAINTASLPDIVFMLLFFFMVSTVMKEVDVKLEQTLPQATELTKLEKRSKVAYIYIGTPRKTEIYGTEPRLQLNDQISDLKDINHFIEVEKAQKGQTMTTSLKVDAETPMGIVTDVKQKLRKSQALKINYSARKRPDKK
jgi:biopolymer transport protein ExbD